MASSFFISNTVIVLAACVQNTRGFARNWPLAPAKFDNSFKDVFCEISFIWVWGNVKFREFLKIFRDPCRSRPLLRAGEQAAYVSPAALWPATWQRPRYRQGCGSALIWVPGSGSRRAKMTHKNRKSTEFSCFEVLDVLFGGLKAFPVAWASFMEAQG